MHSQRFLSRATFYLPALAALLPCWAASSQAAFNVTPIKVNGGEIMESSPTLADIDGDGVQEVLIGTTAWNPHHTAKLPTLLVVLNADGSIRWTQDVQAPINGSPAVGDIDNDGDMEIIVPVNADIKDRAYRNGGVVAYDHNGGWLWTFTTQDIYDPKGYPDGVYSSPTLCDVDGDKDLEIIFGAWDQRIYMLDHLGNTVWNNMPGQIQGPGYYNGSTVWSTAACVDLNDDGSKEIIIGGDITGGHTLWDGFQTSDGGFIYVLGRDGTTLARRFIPEAIYSAPAVADLDGDGRLEIVTGTGFNWWYVHQQQGIADQPYVYAFSTENVFNTAIAHYDPSRLPDLPGWPQPTVHPGYGSPAVADLDRDGDLEIVIGCGNPLTQQSMIYAWHHTGAPVAGWPLIPLDHLGENTNLISSPTIGDVNNDRRPDILISMRWDVLVYNADGSQQDTLRTTWSVWASPAIGDTDNDGKVEVWIGGKNWDEQSSGYVWRFENDVAGFGELPWPQFHHDARHLGVYDAAVQARQGIVPANSLLLKR